MHLSYKWISWHKNPCIALIAPWLEHVLNYTIRFLIKLCALYILHMLVKDLKKYQKCIYLLFQYNFYTLSYLFLLDVFTLFTLWVGPWSSRTRFNAILSKIRQTHIHIIIIEMNLFAMDLNICLYCSFILFPISVHMMEVRQKHPPNKVSSPTSITLQSFKESSFWC